MDDSSIVAFLSTHLCFRLLNITKVDGVWGVVVEVFFKLTKKWRGFFKNSFSLLSSRMSTDSDRRPFLSVKEGADVKRTAAADATPPPPLTEKGDGRTPRSTQLAFRTDSLSVSQTRPLRFLAT